MFICGTLLQGGLGGHPIFCLVIGVVLVAANVDGRIRGIWQAIGVWAYVDDVLFQCPRTGVAALMEVVAEVFQRFKLRLQRAKSLIHIPALAATAVEEWPEDARALGEVLPIAPTGLTILGTEAAGELGLPLGPWAAATAKI